MNGFGKNSGQLLKNIVLPLVCWGFISLSTLHAQSPSPLTDTTQAARQVALLKDTLNPWSQDSIPEAASNASPVTQVMPISRPLSVAESPLHFTARQLVAPTILLSTGIAMDLSQGLKNSQLSFHNNHLAGFHTAADNILLYVPAAIPYGFDLLGIQSKTDIANRTAILIKGELIAAATGYLLKHTIHEWRPDGSNHYSFPSGHTLQVFATATLLSEEYQDRYKWMPYAAYGLATGVGLLRLANNKHYVGDVLVGAALGILSMKLSYWTHQYRWNKHKIANN